MLSVLALCCIPVMIACVGHVAGPSLITTCNGPGWLTSGIAGHRRVVCVSLGKKLAPSHTPSALQIRTRPDRSWWGRCAAFVVGCWLPQRADVALSKAEHCKYIWFMTRRLLHRSHGTRSSIKSRLVSSCCAVSCACIPRHCTPPHFARPRRAACAAHEGII